MRVAPTSARYIPLQRNTYYPSTMVGGFYCAHLWKEVDTCRRQMRTEIIRKWSKSYNLHGRSLEMWSGLFRRRNDLSGGPGHHGVLRTSRDDSQGCSVPNGNRADCDGALVTGLGWYDRLVKRGGIGSDAAHYWIANAMVAPAMEFKQEGLIMGWVQGYSPLRGRFWYMAWRRPLWLVSCVTS